LRRAVVLLVSFALVLAACTDDDEPRADPGPRRGGVLRIGFLGPEGEPALEQAHTLDPTQARSLAELFVADQLFDSLTSYDARTLETRPGLAASWTSTPDQMHWDFTLRKGAKFTNGRAVTSADVKYSLERAARKGVATPVATQLELVTGFRAFNIDGTARNLAGVTAPSPSVVHVDLDEPLSSLPALLGNPAFGIVPLEAVGTTAEKPFVDLPVGSGPFVVRARDAKAIHLVKAPRSPALLAGIDLVLHRDQHDAYTAFTRGEVDFTTVPRSRVAETLRTGRGAEARPYLAVLFYGFNLKNAKFGDPRFREAIARAINREAIVKDVYTDTVRPILGVVPEGTPGFARDACGEKCRHDPDRAKALVAETFGATPPPQISIDFDEEATQRDVVMKMQADLNAVGIPAVLRPHSPEEYVKFAVSGQQELFRLGWIGAYPSADAFLSPLFVTGLTDNLAGFSSGEIDMLLKSARSQADEKQRTALYREAERKIMQQLPIVPIAQYDTHAVVASRVQGLVLTAAGTFDASQVWLTDTAP
jgi:ABC-type oligopeptide transport system substrate-binding subunit